MSGFVRFMSIMSAFGGYYRSYRDTEEAIAVIGMVSLIIAFICTILSLILVTPESRRAALPKFFQFVHDVFNIKWLLIEKIFKAFYIFFTLFILTAGFCLLFVEPLIGLLTMLLGPIIIRLFHELFMMTIIAVKSLISIDNKMSASAAAAKSNPFSESPSWKNYSSPAAPAPIAPAPITPPPTPAATVCSNCGAVLKPGDTFCGECGHKVN